jgi:hypothetical protein
VVEGEEDKDAREGDEGAESRQADEDAVRGVVGLEVQVSKPNWSCNWLGGMLKIKPDLAELNLFKM